MSIQPKQQGMGRREFLLVTSGTALAAMAFGQELLPSIPGSKQQRNYALGYAEFDALRQGDARRGFFPNVSSADSLSPDGNFIRNGVRISIRGANAAAVREGSRSMLLTVQFLAEEGGVQRSYPFYAWSYSKSSGMSSPVSFVVPIDQDQRVRFLLGATAAPAETSAAVSRRGLITAGAASEAGAEPDAISISLLSGDGSAKLRRGYYIFAPLAAGASVPRWSNLQLRNENGLKLFQTDGLDVVPANFDYVILYIDYAKDHSDNRPAQPKGKDNY
jgi:hypothetical protein